VMKSTNSSGTGFSLFRAVPMTALYYHYERHPADTPICNRTLRPSPLHGQSARSTPCRAQAQTFVCRLSRDLRPGVADGRVAPTSRTGLAPNPSQLRHCALKRHNISSRDLSDPYPAFVERVGADRTGRPAEETELGMSTTQVPNRPTLNAPTPAVQRRSVWKHGIAAAVVASVATTVLAAISSAAGVSFAGDTGASIPIAGFAELTLDFSLVGVGIAAVMARKARRPRPAFVRTAIALTALSFVPDLTFGFDAGSAATLITLHTVAAAIVVPTLAGRLAGTR
jgi:hypothetical protein